MYIVAHVHMSLIANHFPIYYKDGKDGRHMGKSSSSIYRHVATHVTTEAGKAALEEDSKSLVTWVCSAGRSFSLSVSIFIFFPSHLSFLWTSYYVPP